MRSKQNTKPVESPTPPTVERLGTPEQQKAAEEFHKSIGQALVDNLNRNVLKNP